MGATEKAILMYRNLDAMRRSHAVRIALGLTCAAGLTACALQALQYTEPTDDEAAELQISTDAPLVLLFYRDATRCTDQLQVRPPATVGITSHKIPANREFALKFFYVEEIALSIVRRCPTQIASFHAEKGKRYLLHYTANREQETCNWVLTEGVGGREERVKVEQREDDPNYTSMGGEGPWCKAKADSR